MSAANLEKVFQEIANNYISIDKNRETYTKHYEKLRNKLYASIKEEKILGKLLKGHHLEGSYGDNLKVKLPNEFDLVFFIEFPENDNIIVRRDPKIPGNVFLDMSEVLKRINKSDNSDIYEQLLKMVNGKNLLIEDKFQNWMQSIFTKVLNKLGNKIDVDGTISAIRYQKNGPAHTIIINHPIEYSVDFVPAIRLKIHQSVLPADKRKYYQNHNLIHWEAVPKPLKPFQPNNTSFRTSYYSAENKMLDDKNNLKQALRVIKKFRDTKNNMTNLKSYYIKTLFLWQVSERDNLYWRKSFGDIVVDMFDELEKVLRPQNKLRYFWDPELNMLSGLNIQQRQDMFNCVNRATQLMRKAAGHPTAEVFQQLHCALSDKQERGVATKLSRPINGIQKETIKVPNQSNGNKVSSGSSTNKTNASNQINQSNKSKSTQVTTNKQPPPADTSNCCIS